MKVTLSSTTQPKCLVVATEQEPINVIMQNTNLADPIYLSTEPIDSTTKGIKLSAGETYTHSALTKSLYALPTTAGNTIVVEFQKGFSGIHFSGINAASPKPDWALGTKKAIVIPATAGTVKTDIAPDAGKRYRLVYGKVQLSTDATVINRTIAVQVNLGSPNELYLPTRAVVPASTSSAAIHFYDVSVLDSAAGITNPTGGVISLKDFIVFSSYPLRISITNGQAGDSYSGFFVFEEVTE